MHILGREGDDGQVTNLGCHRAPDGSDAAPIGFDIESPHAGIVVGKRGSGKSHTVGVFAEGIARADGVTGVVADPMGGLRTLASLPGAAVVEPVVAPRALPPRAWCSLFDVDPTGRVGSLVWRVSADARSLADMQAAVQAADVQADTKRAASNHFSAAQSWEIFDPAGITAATVTEQTLTILDLAGVHHGPANAVLRAIADSLYEAAVDSSTMPLPWVFVDEAHTFFDGIAAPGLNRLLTRGRHPGVSLVLATQRPAAVPAIAVSQADFLITHRLTSAADREALDEARPTYVRDALVDRQPSKPGEAVIIDDRTEVARAVRIRDRSSPDGGESPCASQRAGNHE